MPRRVIAIVACAACLLVLGPSALSGQTASTVVDRICRLLGIDSKLVRRSRGGADMVSGRRLMRADLEKKQIDVLWDCGGCSSPVLISAQRVAVLKQSDLWTVGIDGASPRKELSLPDAEALVGITAEPPIRILILARAAGSQRPVRVQPKLVDVATWTIAAAPPDIDMVFNREDAFASFPRPDEYRNGARLKTSAGRPWHVQTERVDTAGAVNQPLFAGWPAAPGMSAATQRFDPIWVDDRRVVFLELP